MACVNKQWRAFQSEPYIPACTSTICRKFRSTCWHCRSPVGILERVVPIDDSSQTSERNSAFVSEHRILKTGSIDNAYTASNSWEMNGNTTAQRIVDCQCQRVTTTAAVRPFLPVRDWRLLGVLRTGSGHEQPLILTRSALRRQRNVRNSISDALASPI